MIRPHRNGPLIGESDDTASNDDAVRPQPRRSFFDRLRHRPDDVASSRCDAAGVRTVAVVADLDDGSFFDALDEHLTVVDFWAPWCGPCKQLHPLFATQAADHATDGLQFARVNIDENPAVASAFDIMSIPTIIVVDPDGRELAREIGLPSRRRLEQLVRTAGAFASEFTETGAS